MSLFEQCEKICKPRAVHQTAYGKLTITMLEEYLYDLTNGMNNNLKEEKMTKLEQLKAVKTTEFDGIVTPVMEYIDANYKEYKEDLNTELVNEILEEIEEKEGMLVFIGANNKLYTPYRTNRSIDTYQSRKINTYESKLRATCLLYNSNEKPVFEKRFQLYESNSYSTTCTFNNDLSDAYYIKDIKLLIEFFNKEQEEIAKEDLAKRLEQLEEDNTYLAKAKEYGLEIVDRYKINRLDKIKAAQEKGLNKLTTVELLEMLQV